MTRNKRHIIVNTRRMPACPGFSGILPAYTAIICSCGWLGEDFDGHLADSEPPRDYERFDNAYPPASSPSPLTVVITANRHYPNIPYAEEVALGWMFTDQKIALRTILDFLNEGFGDRVAPHYVEHFVEIRITGRAQPVCAVRGMPSARTSERFASFCASAIRDFVHDRAAYSRESGFDGPFAGKYEPLGTLKQL